MNPVENLTPAQRELWLKAKARWMGLEIRNVDQRTFVVTKPDEPSFRFPAVGSATLDELENTLRRLGK